MRRVLFGLCVGITVIFPVAAADPPKRPATTTDWDRLQGTWVQVSSEDRGKVKSEADDPSLLTFTGNTLILRSGDRVVYGAEKGTPLISANDLFQEISCVPFSSPSSGSDRRSD
jgi:hypothetical protein